MYNKPSEKNFKVFRGTHRIDCGGSTTSYTYSKKESLAYPCIIDNVWYNNRAKAKKALGISDYRTLTRRLTSPKYPSYIYF